MPVPTETAELLFASSGSPTMTQLAMTLLDSGVLGDVVVELGQARDAFYKRGGHAVLVLDPELPPAVASEIATSLAKIDPDLRVVAFGEDTLRGSNLRVQRISFHPTSRAAAGSLLKIARLL